MSQNAISTTTTIVAAYAAVVSTASLVVSLLSWRSAGLKLRVRAAYFPPNPSDIGTAGMYTIWVDNRSRADITIEQIFVPSLLGHSSPPDGPELPYRMPAHSSAHWELPPYSYEQARMISKGQRWPIRVEVRTAIGTASAHVWDGPIGPKTWLLQRIVWPRIG